MKSLNLGALNRKSLRLALRRWDSSQKLGEHPLSRLRVVDTRRQSEGYSATPIGYGVALRDVLRMGIKRLVPEDGPPNFLDRRWRSYLILSEQYLSGRSPEYLAGQMAVARSTYDHEQAAALEQLAGILSEWEQEGLPARESRARLNQVEGLPGKVAFLAPPKPPYPLEGRGELLGQIKAVLFEVSGSAIAALSGLPGVGKTALAIAVASDPEVLARFPDGVLWAGLGHPRDLLATMGTWGFALGLSVEDLSRLTNLDQRAKAIQAAIGLKRMLLVIDDVWRSEDARAFKLGGPHCAYLATTRFPRIAVDFAGTGATAVHELDEADGLRLLEQFAPSVVRSDPASAVALVRAVGALPLGIVLMGRYLQQEYYLGQPRRIHAALENLRQAQAKLLDAGRPPGPVGEMGSRSGLPFSLLAAIEASDSALDGRSQAALRALSIFPPRPNSFDESAAMEVASASAETLDSLADHGLLEVSAPGRYSLHPTVAEYARLHLVDAVPHRRMARYFAAMLESHPPEEPALELERENILAALQAAFEHGMRNELMRAANRFYGYLEAKGLPRTGLMHLERAMEAARTEGDRSALLLSLGNLGRATERLGQYALSEKYDREGLEIARADGDEEAECAFLMGLGVSAFHRGDYALAATHYEGGLRLARSGDRRGKLAALLANMGALVFNRGDLAQAEACFWEGLTFARELGDRRLVSALLANLGVAAARRGDLARAESCFLESLELARSAANRASMSFLLTNLGTLAYDRGDHARAEAFFLEALTLAQEMADRARVSHLLSNLGTLATARKDYSTAELRLGEGLAIAREIGHRENTSLLCMNLGMLAKERGELAQGEVYFQESLALAQEMGHRRYACIALGELGEIRLARGEADQASDSLSQALEVAREIGLRDREGLAMFGLARVALRRGDIEEAVRLGSDARQVLRTLAHPVEEEVSAWLERVRGGLEPSDV